MWQNMIPSYTVFVSMSAPGSECPSQGAYAPVKVRAAKKLPRERGVHMETLLCVSTWMLMSVRREEQGASIWETHRKKLCTDEPHEEGAIEENKIIFKSCRKFTSEERESREEDNLACN